MKRTRYWAVKILGIITLSICGCATAKGYHALPSISQKATSAPEACIFLAVDDIYTNGTLKIKDSEIYNKFIDFHDGYRAQMKKWATENEITIGEMVITPTLQYPEIENENITKKPIAIAGVGTLVAAGLIIFSKMWIAVAAELLTLGVSAYSYKKSKESRETRYAFRVKKYEMQIEQEKARLVNGLIKDLKTWLGNAESFSNDVILKFGIQ
jgi:hypothetical protein